jgi:CO/xanthine dehydrogenase Mo-binding subunit
MCGYTFCMKLVVWLLVLAAAAVLAYSLVKWRRRRAELKRRSEERYATLMAEAIAGARQKKASKG